MTVYDLQMMARYRASSPSLESLVMAIASVLGINVDGSSAPEPARPPDPRETIARAFSGAQFSESGMVDAVVLRS